jgi:hypothetical protein
MAKQNSKRIGNTFERKVARQLSIWIYDDPHVLKREPTSGGVKNVYSGDIFPMKQLTPDQPEFNLLVECKYGYAQFVPTLMNYSVIEQWYLKSLAESNATEKQKVVFVIANFKSKKGILLCTNIELNTIYCKCVLCIRNNGSVEWVYCYDYNEMLKYSYKEILGNCNDAI